MPKEDEVPIGLDAGDFLPCGCLLLVRHFRSSLLILAINFLEAVADSFLEAFLERSRNFEVVGPLANRWLVGVSGGL